MEFCSAAASALPFLATPVHALGSKSILLSNNPMIVSPRDKPGEWFFVSSESATPNAMHICDITRISYNFGEGKNATPEAQGVPGENGTVWRRILSKKLRALGYRLSS